MSWKNNKAGGGEKVGSYLFEFLDVDVELAP